MNSDFLCWKITNLCPPSIATEPVRRLLATEGAKWTFGSGEDAVFDPEDYDGVLPEDGVRISLVERAVVIVELPGPFEVEVRGVWGDHIVLWPGVSVVLTIIIDQLLAPRYLTFREEPRNSILLNSVKCVLRQFQTTEYIVPQASSPNWVNGFHTEVTRAAEAGVKQTTDDDFATPLTGCFTAD